MSIEEVAVDLILCVVSVIAVMYWFEWRSRDLYRRRTNEFMEILSKRSEKAETELLVHTEKLAAVSTTITVRLDNMSMQLKRIEAQHGVSHAKDD